MSRPLCFVACVALVALLAPGCAGGDEVTTTNESGGSAGVAFYGGFGGTGATGGSGGASGGQGGSGASGGTSPSGGQGGTSGGTGGTGGSACPEPNTCETAEDLGVVSGDTNNTPPVSKTGFGSTFVKVRVTEDNHSVIGQALKLNVSLEVSLATDYDVYAYLNVNTDVSPCGLVPFDKSDSGGFGINESFDMTWGDGLTGSGNDDSRTVVVEVKHKAGPCDASAPFILTLAGNK